MDEPCATQLIGAQLTGTLAGQYGIVPGSGGAIGHLTGNGGVLEGAGVCAGDLGAQRQGPFQGRRRTGCVFHLFMHTCEGRGVNTAPFAASLFG
ncbi:hypothetical protein GCM10010168_77070 [Actinoplanes ianthinogenes]|uniref:Uncharacterized protein n=1 Tax=Actinoplanes ianthinogenes TaxID=122358 RepID=A0ABN6CT98_9ACTN|nr:hypothetical protein [Actinoplanes ianthinogenes]BCJ48367.1 hypothetical protein Aiant_90240 [Actinoplanes ianthinogenes]GGR46860.1 hypothetical protein GCM10010168_77070 [Actinoplanes ianthinogenes]